MDHDGDATDHYAVLQIQPTAHPDIIRAAYRTLLKALGNHPDLGGTNGRARTIIEAYKTLSNPDRRRAYDHWLKAHSHGKASAAIPVPGAAPAPAGLPPRLVRWIRAVLSEYREDPEAPFAKRFDVVLAAPGPLSARVYLKWCPLITCAEWPTLFILSRAVGVARHGLLPSTDVVLFVAEQVREREAFLAEAGNHSAEWAWNRCVAGLCTLWPVRIHTGRITWVPTALRRLRDALGIGPDPLRGSGDS
jgi:hypothetical protein